MITINLKNGDMLSTADRTIKVIEYKAETIYGVDIISNEHILVNLSMAAKSKQQSKLVIAILPCSKKKSSEPGMAATVYTGTLFRLSLKYAQAVLTADIIFILSAKHGVLSIYDPLVPYDLSLSSLTSKERSTWGLATGAEMINRLERVWHITLPSTCRWIFLAGTLYYKSLARFFNDHNVTPERPLQGLGIGNQQALLKEALDNEFEIVVT